ncbi:MAG: hypothetical protein Q8P68_02735, partial [Candidatus Peregrinibacteria bacterium]|nr:hypothetical protein [Candidatus Peregrinibacteria bacterium]
KKGFETVVEFGAKLAGLSKLQVQRAIQIDRKLEDENLSELRTSFIRGEISMHKIARIVSIAETDNEEILVYAVKNLSKGAIETLIKDERRLAIEDKSLSGNFEKSCLNIDLKSVPGHTFTLDKPQGQANLDFKNQTEIIDDKINSKDVSRLDFQLSENVVQKLNELNAKGFDVNEILEKMLDERREKAKERENMIANEVVMDEQAKRTDGKEVGRNIPAKVKRVISERAGTKCEVSGCMRDAKNMHHTIRFGLRQSHDPRYLMQLCKEHHELTHVLDEKYLEKRRA